jgi:fluoroacetyl-CoA thioesterase
MTLMPGLEAEVVREVDETRTARHLGSGDGGVLATPAMLAMVEGAAMGAVQGYLPEDQTTVGARVELEHLAPTPQGASVTARVRLEQIDGRKLIFAFEVTDPSGVVGRGTHTRVVVDRSKFMEGASGRADPPALP